MITLVSVEYVELQAVFKTDLGIRDSKMTYNNRIGVVGISNEIC